MHTQPFQPNTFDKLYWQKQLFLLTNKQRSITNCCCSTSHSLKGFLAIKKLEIEELEILGHFLIGFFLQFFSKNYSPFLQNFNLKQHVLHQHYFSVVSLQKIMV
jgi:hypothetical protein